MDERLILFDVDGTLVDTAGAGKSAIQEAFLEIFGIDAVAMATRTRRFAGMTDPTIFSSLSREAGISDGLYRSRRDELHDCYLEHLRAVMRRDDPRRRILPGVLPLLEDLDSRSDAHTGLLTGNLEAGARIKLEPFGLNRFFPDGGFSSDHCDRREIAAIARDKLSHRYGIRFSSSSVVVIGDTVHDVDCARANGFRSIAVETGWVRRSSLEAADPDTVFEDLTDLQAVLRAIGWNRN
jgi:phosphoglycolate phosphatase-like HAD superfamily hydrolase